MIVVARVWRKRGARMISRGVERKLADKILTKSSKSSSCAIETICFREKERERKGALENFIYFRDDPIIVNDFEIDI